VKYTPEQEIERAKEILATGASEQVVEAAFRLVEEGKGEWRLDPEFENVVGLVKPGTRNAWIVVYISMEDFEESQEFWDYLVSIGLG